MLKTITVGSCLYIQGTFVKASRDGRIFVRVGDTLYSGLVVS